MKSTSTQIECPCLVLLAGLDIFVPTNDVKRLLEREIYERNRVGTKLSEPITNGKLIEGRSSLEVAWHEEGLHGGFSLSMNMQQRVLQTMRRWDLAFSH